MWQIRASPCSTHLQVSMCLNLQCPPEGGLYKSAQKPRCHTDSGGQTLRAREAGRVHGYQTEEYHMIVCVQTIIHGAADEFVASERDKKDE